jgi:hypothetical protein
MADHNMLREKLSATNRYRRLVDLRREVQSSRGAMPFSIYAELENRVDEKIRTFDYPRCDQAKITILFSNGLAMELEPDECVSAMKTEMRLSSYIFSKYPSAVDFNIDANGIVGTYGKMSASREEAKKEPARSSPLHDMNDGKSLQTKVDLLVTKIDRLEKMYNETIPKITKGLDDLKEKMDFLYKKMIEEKK